MIDYYIQRFLIFIIKRLFVVVLIVMSITQTTLLVVNIKFYKKLLPFCGCYVFNFILFISFEGLSEGTFHVNYIYQKIACTDVIPSVHFIFGFSKFYFYFFFGNEKLRNSENIFFLTLSLVEYVSRKEY